MMTKEEVIKLISDVKDPHLHKSFKETGGIEEVKIREKLGHISIKLALAKPNTAEQMQLQFDLVELLKKNGAESVGLRFSQLPQDTINKLSEDNEPKTLLTMDNPPQFVAIASGKGGVGKSTVTVNLAIALARLGKRVGIIDADIYGFSVPDMMGIEKRPNVQGKKIIPVERFGVKVISMGFFVEDNSPIIWRGPMLAKMFNSFFQEVDWGELDYVLIDLPPGTGDMAMNVQDMIPACKQIVVTTPHPTAAFVASRAGQMAKKGDHELLGVVENMAYFDSKKTGEREYIFGKGGADKLAEVLESEIIGRLPIEQPYKEEHVFAPSVYQEEHPIGKEYTRIAERIVNELEANK